MGFQGGKAKAPLKTRAQGEKDGADAETQGEMRCPCTGLEAHQPQISLDSSSSSLLPRAASLNPRSQPVLFFFFF